MIMGSGTPEGFRVGRTVDPFTGKLNPLFFPGDAGLLAVAEKAALDLKLAPVKTASGERNPWVGVFESSRPRFYQTNGISG